MSTQTASRKTLFQLSTEWVALIAALEDAAGELTPEIQAAWDGLMADLGQSVDRYGHVLKSLEVQAVAHRDRAEYHERAARARDQAKGRLKDRLCQVMQTMGVRKLPGEDFTGYLRSTDIVTIETEQEIPEMFWRVKRELDRVAIGKELKTGGAVPGATLQTRESAYIK